MTKGAERAKRVERGPGGGLEVWGGGLWSSGRDCRCGWADGLRGLGRDGPPRERGTDGDAGDDSLRELALTFE